MFSTDQAATYDRISIRNIRVHVSVGAELPERRVLQEVCIDLELAVEMSGARRFDRLEATVDYFALHGRIVKAAQAKPVALLEHVGEALLQEITCEPLVLWAKVSLAKIGLLAGATPQVHVIGRRPTGVAIGLGANLGDPPVTLARAVAALDALGKRRACSSLYRTKPWGPVVQTDFYNAVVILETTLLPHAMLAALKQLETRLGRVAGERYGPRMLDCDLLYDEGAILSDAVLQLPHPRLAERAFVLAPLSEIEAVYRPAYERLAADERAGVERLAEWPSLGANPEHP